MHLCFATNNRHKIDEVAQVVGGGFQIVSLQEIGCYDELPENQTTLEGNAKEKADYVWNHFKTSCFADDSGLEVEALNGNPGVDSAHYAGAQRNAHDNIDLLLQNLQGNTNRKARFRTCIVLILNGERHLFEGTVNGTILDKRRGTDGFGYDSVFVPDGYKQTFAEMPLAEKNKISHRAVAMQQLLAFWEPQNSIF